MTNPTEAFFDELGHRGHDPQVGRVTGTIRFEVTQRGKTEIRSLSIERGHLAVSQSDAAADCVIRIERSVLDAIIGGKTNAMAAMLRGALTADGDPEMMVIFRRLLPPLPPSERRGAIAAAAGW